MDLKSSKSGQDIRLNLSKKPVKPSWAVDNGNEWPWLHNTADSTGQAPKLHVVGVIVGPLAQYAKLLYFLSLYRTVHCPHQVVSGTLNFLWFPTPSICFNLFPVCSWIFSVACSIGIAKLLQLSASCQEQMKIRKCWKNASTFYLLFSLT